MNGFSVAALIPSKTPGRCSTRTAEALSDAGGVACCSRLFALPARPFVRSPVLIVFAVSEPTARAQLLMTYLATSTMSRPIGELVDFDRPTLTRILLRFRIPAEDAEDLLQEIVVQYLRKRSTIREPSKWLAGALRNECRLYWRRRHRCVYDAVDQGILDALAVEDVPRQERAALVSRLVEHISTLQPRCQDVLSLRYRLGYSNDEIAGKTGYRPSSIDKIARRCLDALSRRIVGGRLIGRVKSA